MPVPQIPCEGCVGANCPECAGRGTVDKELSRIMLAYLAVEGQFVLTDEDEDGADETLQEALDPLWFALEPEEKALLKQRRAATRMLMNRTTITPDLPILAEPSDG